MQRLIAAELALPAACLRSWQPGDAPRLVEAWADTDIRRWNPVPPTPNLATAQRWIAGESDRLERGLSVDLVVDHDDLGVVGEVGLSGFNPKHRGALMGYWLLPQARGQGLASQAVEAVAEWAHQALDLDVIVARCHESNQPSQAVARRAGFESGGLDSSGYVLWRSRHRSD